VENAYPNRFYTVFFGGQGGRWFDIVSQDDACTVKSVAVVY
jgi:hypothetical protein